MDPQLTRRSLIKSVGTSAAVALPRFALAADTPPPVPSYLKAGVWFDPIMGYYARPDLFPIDETYALIRRLQPQTLISFKQGATGDEDFAAPERSGRSLADRVQQRYGPEKAAVARRAWDRNKSKHNEICDTLQPRGSAELQPAT